MIRRGYDEYAWVKKFALIGSAVLLVFQAGCIQLPGSAAPAPTATVRAAKAPARPTAIVRRDSIVESVKVLGRVAAVREGELYFKNAGRLKKIYVQSGQEVAEGQLLAEMDVGDLESRIATAQVTYDTAKIKLEQMKGNRGDAELRRQLDLTNAAIAVQQAENGLAKAEADLAGVKAGPTPVETAEAGVRAAQMELDNARRNLTTTQKTVERNISDRQNEVNWYEANYGDNLSKYNRGQITKDELDKHWNNLTAAKDRLDAARADGDTTLAKAQAAISRAEDGLRKAQGELEAKKSLPPDWHIKQAEQAVTLARLTLEKARAEYAQKEASGEDLDVALQEKTVEQAKASLGDLKTQMGDSRLVAPFAGKVMVARGRIGDQMAALQSVVSLADPSELQVRGDLMDADVPKVALGQDATVTVDALPGTTLKGVVVGVPGNFASQGGTVQDRSVQITVDWPKAGAQLGMLARVTIVVQKKDGVLIVPAKAVKTVGKRRFVEYMDGSLRRSANVEVGVVTDTDAEIVSGLTEGQVILSGQ